MMKKTMLGMLCALCVLAVPMLASAEAKLIGEIPLVLRGVGVHGGVLPSTDGYVQTGWDGKPGYAGSKAAAIGVDQAGQETWRVVVEEQQPNNGWTFSRVISLADGTLVAIKDVMMANDEQHPSDLVWIKDAQVTATMPVITEVSELDVDMFPATQGFLLFRGEQKKADKHRGTFYVAAVERRDSQGNVLWCHVFADNEVHFYEMLEVGDGFVLVGEEEEQETGKRHSMGVIAKFSADGKLLWLTSSPGKIWKNYSDIVQTPEGNLLAAGVHTIKDHEIGLPDEVPVLACFAPDGKLLWEKEYPRPVNNAGFHGIAARDGGYWALCSEQGEQDTTLNLMMLGHDGQLLDVQALTPGESEIFTTGKFYQQDGATRIMAQALIRADVTPDRKIYFYEIQ